MWRTSLALALGLVLTSFALGQDKPPEHEQLRQAAEEVNRLALKSASDLAARHAANARRIVEAEEALKQPTEDLAQLQAAYAGGEGAPRRPSKDEVLIRLRELTRLTDRDAHDARLARLRDEADAVGRARDRAATALANLEDTFKGLRAQAKEVDWDSIAFERRRALTAVRTGAEEVLADFARLRSLWSRRHETLRRTLYVLRNENLLLRGDSHITMPALRLGVDDLRALPAWIGRAAGGTGGYLADPANRGALLRFVGVYLLAAVLLFLFGRWMRRHRARATGTGVAAGVLRVTMRLLTAVVIAVLLFLVPFLAGRMLPEIPDGASDWLRDLAYVLGAFWLLQAVVRELFVGHGDEPALLALAPGAARRLAVGLHLLLYLSLFFVPVLTALNRFGYGNRGVVEFLQLVYEGLLGLVLIVLLRRPFLLSLVPTTDTRGAKLLRLLIVWLQPVAILLVPTLWVLAALRYDILAGLITRFATSALVVAIVGGLLYRLARTLVAVWLGSVYPPEKSGIIAARHEAAVGGAGFVLGLVFLFVSLAAFLSFAGSDLDEMRSFFDTPLPLQGGEGRVVTWWNVILAIVLLWFFFALTKHAKAVLRELVLARTRMDKGVQYTTAMLVGYVLVGTGLYLAIQEVFDLTNLGYIVAALSVGIGFGLQEIISNFVSGLILLFERPLKVGDLVSVGSRMGVVKNISIRATTVLTNDNIYLLVPNRDFIGQTVTNFAHKDPKMRLRVPLGVSYSSDTAQVRKVLLEVAAAHDAVLRHPGPDVHFMAFADSSLNFDLLVWISDPPQQQRIASQLYFAIFQAFRENDIEIPFPQRDLHLRSAIELPVGKSD